MRGAGAIGDDDTADLHAVDTERAGRELCRQSAVRVLVEEGPERVRELIAMGVPFDPELNLEGGHSRRRVSSVDGAATGWAVTSLLSRHAVTARCIATFENGVITGGFGSRINEVLAEVGYRGACLRFGWPDLFIPQGSFDALAERFGLTAPAIAERISNVMK